MLLQRRQHVRIRSKLQAMKRAAISLRVSAEKHLSSHNSIPFKKGNRQMLVAFSVAIWRIQILYAIGILVEAARLGTCDSVAINAVKNTS
jgi:hypothetical protein